MASQRITDMTRDELQQLIDDAIDRRLHLQGLLKPKNTQKTTELLDDLRRLRFTPPAGAKSTLEMLREDRDA